MYCTACFLSSGFVMYCTVCFLSIGFVMYVRRVSFPLVYSPTSVL
ncbi:unnamed protein product [Ascophyllum nodosum]